MKKRKPLKQTILSVAAALFGVQSRHNQQKDFAQLTPWQVIMVAIVMIAVLVILLITLSYVLSQRL
ncbi:TPA: DUF2970 domain-containing protein [Photobacterium damselae]|nr:DUF2970 domain-containing protein [Photobacterium damselae]AWK80816.1 hypothetical protein BST98_01020 [Photobacterium damselae]MBA5684595.1 DUF2970 domain-containing protein [Photobacterium damselae subsp. damselae]MBE8128158.1 DUF2970 domain-containing protein [Photobacterium damselae subsp. piscicida]MCG3812741.1 DUF2970 domain-containing protein [Photobacterium damselae]MCG3825209.1 DUF2970 domain-containing protein [Photobacterium damselae]